MINAHTHLELTALANLCPSTPASFTHWILGLIAQRRQLSELEIQRSIDDAIATLHESGTTAVGDISASHLSIEPLLASGLAGVVYLEVLGFDVAAALERLKQTQTAIDHWRKRENAMKIGLTVHAPYSCVPELFIAATKWCIAEAVPLTIHIAESPDEVALLQLGTGPMAELNARFAPNTIWHPPQCSPIQYLARLGVLEAKPVLVHGVQVDEADLATIKASGCVMVHCPRSNSNLACGRMPIERYLAHEIPLAIGTDSLASAQSLDVRDEIAYALELHGNNIDVTILNTMASIGGKQALGIREQ